MTVGPIQSMWTDDERRRGAELAAAGFNVARLPAGAVTAELGTDAARADAPHPEGARAPGQGRAELDAAVADAFGPGVRATVTGSGRGAESVVAGALAARSPRGREAWRVLADEVYVSGRWWIERFGGTTTTVESAGGARGAPAGGPIAAVYATAPRASLSRRAGSTVGLERLDALRRWRDAHVSDAPMVLDGSRLWEDATRTGTSARALSERADVILLSASKDLGCGRGGLVLARSDVLTEALRSVAADLEPEDGGLDDAELAGLARGLQAADDTTAIAARVERIERLAASLTSGGVPVHAAGNGSIYLDADRWLPSVPVDALRAQTLLALLYVITGWRGLGTGTDDPPDAAIVRIAVRDHADEIARQLPVVRARTEGWATGLRALPRDRSAPYLQPAAPLDAETWPAARPRGSDDGEAEVGDRRQRPSWLVGRCGRGPAPLRAMAAAAASAGAALHLGGTTSPADAAIVARLLRRFDATSGGPVLAVRVDDARADSSSLHGPDGPDAPDVYWSAGATGGTLAVRSSSPLAPYFDAAALFTFGSWLTASSTHPWG